MFGKGKTAEDIFGDNGIDNKIPKIDFKEKPSEEQLKKREKLWATFMGAAGGLAIISFGVLGGLNGHLADNSAKCCQSMTEQKNSQRIGSPALNKGLITVFGVSALASGVGAAGFWRNADKHCKLYPKPFDHYC